MESTQMISKPIFALPGSKDVEGFLTVTLCMVFGVFFLQAIYPFYRIWLNTIKSGRSSISARQKCEAWLFLALAAVSFIVVNWFRSGMMDVLSHLNQNIHGSEEWHNKTPEKLWFTVLGALEGSKRKIVQLVYPTLTSSDKVSTYLVQQAERYHEYDLSQSLWDCFKMNVATYCRFWWTQQWFMGYTAWAMFVGVQGRARRMTKMQIFSYIIIAPMIGLAGAQCLFYALLRLKPRTERTPARFPEPIVAATFVLSEVLLVAGLPVLLVRSSQTIKTVWFSLAQAHVIFQPALGHSISRHSFVGWSIYGSARQSVRDAKRILVFLWFALSMAGLIMHLHSCYMAYGEIAAGTYRSMYQHNLNEVIHPSSWWDLVKETIHVLATGAQVWNHWLRALGWDAVLSFCALEVWIIVNNTDVHGMLKCSTNPWLDEAQAAVGQVASRLGDATEDMYEEIRDSQPLAQARDAWSSAKEEAKRRTASAMHSFADTADEDDEEDDYGRATTRARSTRRASVGRPRSQSRGAVSPTKRNASSRRSSRARQPSLSRRVSGLVDDGLNIMSFPALKPIKGNGEALVLTYALWLLGGLGMASSAVFGAEE